jgi:hypothetical protein
MLKRLPAAPKGVSQAVLKQVIASPTDLPKCCDQNCLAINFPDHLNEIFNHRTEKVKENKMKKRTGVLLYLDHNTDPHLEETAWLVWGKKVCQAAWALYNGMSERTLRLYISQFHDGVRADAAYHGNKGKKKPSGKRF